MNALEREDRVQVLARVLLVERARGGQTMSMYLHEVETCFGIAELFVDAADRRKAAIPLPLPPKTSTDGRPF